METKFTKGEWRYFKSRHSYKIQTPNGNIADVYSTLESEENEDLYNVKIMASAPDLLEALVDLYESLPDGYTSECLPKVRMAIKKATE